MSLIGKMQLRFLETCHEQQKLVVRKTKLFEFMTNEQGTRNSNTMLGMMAAYRVGHGDPYNTTINGMLNEWVTSGSGSSEAQYPMPRSFMPNRLSSVQLYDQAHLFGITANALETADDILTHSGECQRYIAIGSSMSAINDVQESENK
ncbi:hypothetical protein N7454_005398 [Penicillium verhagenii]|nr:hypothetical protein N7454_005398 [Penicillium verhagenii]